MHTLPPVQTGAAEVISSAEETNDDSSSTDDAEDATQAKEATPDQTPVRPFQFLLTPQGPGWGGDPIIDLGKIEPDDDSDDPDFDPNDMDDDDSDMDDDDSDLVGSDMDDDEHVNLGLGVLDGGEINLERCLTRGFGIQLAAARGATEWPAQYKPTGPGRWTSGYKDRAYSLHFSGDGIPKHPFRYIGPATYPAQSAQPHMDVSTILWLLCMGGKEGSNSTLVGFFASDLCDTALLTEMASFLYSPGFHSVCTHPSDERREYSYSMMGGPGVKRRGRWDVINQRRLIDREQKEGYM